jgi:hypothetical protein
VHNLSTLLTGNAENLSVELSIIATV